MAKVTIAPLFTWRSAVCQSDLTATQRHVALTLSLYMNERGGSAFPGAGRLADECALHISTVRRALADLTDCGWLDLVAIGGKRGEHRRANEYVATRPEPQLPLAQDDPSRCATPSTGLATPSTGRGVPLAQDDPSTSFELSKNSSSGDGTPPFSTKLAAQLKAEHGWEPPIDVTTFQAFQALLAEALERLPEKEHRPITMGIIAARADTAEVKLTPEARSHTARLVSNYPAADVLDAWNKAIVKGAGINGDYAKDPLAMSKYAAAILGRKDKA